MSWIPSKLAAVVNFGSLSRMSDDDQCQVIALPFRELNGTQQLAKIVEFSPASGGSEAMSNCSTKPLGLMVVAT